MVLTYLVFLSLCAVAPARAVAHNSCSRLSEYGSPVLSRGPWRPAMEARTCSGIHTFVTYISPGTSASFLAFVFVDNIYT
jgi:hypothetical protein